jgi:hypothetical protein
MHHSVFENYNDFGIVTIDDPWGWKPGPYVHVHPTEETTGDSTARAQTGPRCQGDHRGARVRAKHSPRPLRAGGRGADESSVGRRVRRTGARAVGPETGAPRFGMPCDRTTQQTRGGSQHRHDDGVALGVLLDRTGTAWLPCGNYERARQPARPGVRELPRQPQRQPAAAPGVADRVWRRRPAHPVADLHPPRRGPITCYLALDGFVRWGGRTLVREPSPHPEPMPTLATIFVAIYVRISKDAQAKGFGVRDQEQDCASLQSGWAGSSIASSSTTTSARPSTRTSLVLRIWRCSRPCETASSRLWSAGWPRSPLGFGRTEPRT